MEEDDFMTMNEKIESINYDMQAQYGHEEEPWSDGNDSNSDY